MLENQSIKRTSLSTFDNAVSSGSRQLGSPDLRSKRVNEARKGLNRSKGTAASRPTTSLKRSGESEAELNEKNLLLIKGPAALPQNKEM